MSFVLWFSLFCVCLLGAMSPGPSLAVVMRATTGRGRTAGIAAALAHAAGVGFYSLLTVLGLATLLTRNPALFLGLQVAGALYLFWLGARSLVRLRASTSNATQKLAGYSAAGEGFLVALLNPKLALFMLALFSQFLAPNFGFWEKAVMVTTVALVDGLWYCLVAVLMSRPLFLAQLRAKEALINHIFGLILITLAVTIIAKVIVAP